MTEKKHNNSILVNRVVPCDGCRVTGKSGSIAGRGHSQARVEPAAMAASQSTTKSNSGAALSSRWSICLVFFPALLASVREPCSKSTDR